VDAPPEGLPVSCSSAGDARMEEPVPAPVRPVAADPVLLGQMLLDPSQTLEVAREGRGRLEEVFDNALRRSFVLGDEGVYRAAAAAAKLLPSAPHLLSMSRKHLRSLGLLHLGVARRAFIIHTAQRLIHGTTPPRSPSHMNHSTPCPLLEASLPPHRIAPLPSLPHCCWSAQWLFHKSLIHSIQLNHRHINPCLVRPDRSSVSLLEIASRCPPEGNGDFTPLSCLEAAERLMEICPGSFRSMWGWEHAAEV
jgi:hypothetical protein